MAISIEDRLLNGHRQDTLVSTRKRFLRRASDTVSAVLLGMTEQDTLEFGIGLAACYNEMVWELLSLSDTGKQG